MLWYRNDNHDDQCEHEEGEEHDDRRIQSSMPRVIAIDGLATPQGNDHHEKPRQCPQGEHQVTQTPAHRPQKRAKAVLIATTTDRGTLGFVRHAQVARTEVTVPMDTVAAHPWRNVGFQCLSFRQREYRNSRDVEHDSFSYESPFYYSISLLTFQ